MKLYNRLSCAFHRSQSGVSGVGSSYESLRICCMRNTVAYLMNMRCHVNQSLAPVSFVFLIRCDHISAFWFNCSICCFAVNVELADCRAWKRRSRDIGNGEGLVVGVGYSNCWSACWPLVDFGGIVIIIMMVLLMVWLLTMSWKFCTGWQQGKEAGRQWCAKAIYSYDWSAIVRPTYRS
jgi:hypothetical protein